MTADIYQIDFKKKSLKRIIKGIPIWQCKSCGTEYEVGNGVMGIEFAKGFRVCSVCVNQANELLKGD